MKKYPIDPAGAFPSHLGSGPGRVQSSWNWGVAATLALNGLMLLFFAWELLGGFWFSAAW